jgi:hypothetical protein
LNWIIPYLPEEIGVDFSEEIKSDIIPAPTEVIGQGGKTLKGGRKDSLYVNASNGSHVWQE